VKAAGKNNPVKNLVNKILNKDEDLPFDDTKNNVDNILNKDNKQSSTNMPHVLKNILDKTSHNKLKEHLNTQFQNKTPEYHSQLHRARKMLG
jgi:hypothetical protein